MLAEIYDRQWDWVVPLATECEAVCEVQGRAQAQIMVSERATIGKLRRALREGSGLVRRKALHLLSFYESRTVLQDLTFALEEDPSPVVRHEAAYFLGYLKDTEAVSYLVRALLNDPSELVRHEAAEALGDLGDRRAISALLHATKDVSGIVRETAEISLLQLAPNGDACSPPT